MSLPSLQRIAGLRRKVPSVIANSIPIREDLIAEQLGADRDDVAEACGQLLLDGTVAMNPDGTYRLTSP